MAQIPFNRDAMAKWYARQHRQTDSGIREIYYLPRVHLIERFVSSRSIN